MSSLLVFYGVCRLEIQSVMLAFLTGFMSYWPSNLLSGYLSLLPCVNKHTVYTFTVYRGVVRGHLRGGGLRQIKHLPQHPCTG
jgi:hypothetical protein